MEVCYKDPMDKRMPSTDPYNARKDHAEWLSRFLDRSVENIRKYFQNLENYLQQLYEKLESLDFEKAGEKEVNELCSLVEKINKEYGSSAKYVVKLFVPEEEIEDTDKSIEEMIKSVENLCKEYKKFFIEDSSS